MLSNERAVVRQGSFPFQAFGFGEAKKERDRLIRGLRVEAAAGSEQRKELEGSQEKGVSNEAHVLPRARAKARFTF